ncbi:MarR family transcriptional regulator [Novosphingobium sp. 1949]|uniref:MarR family transcriptional regulator n=1 Tax=Novosphingobium organovorum TaxID=2930092 RepID=A0ABT0BA41_9SPHN|nr:MarR family transcriptional regulator [Novosphingobium organovorum]MCJ2181809.1 MarR family transcriptional regulator [Novosphingobium organovorum]
MGTIRNSSTTPPGASGAHGRGDLDSVLGFHIRLAHGAVYRHFSETFSELELTQKQVSVLWLVAEQPGLIQADLGQQLQMDRATTTEIINRLAARGLIRREPSPFDRRKSALYLESEGERVLGEARTSIRAHENWLKERFSPAEVETLIGLLERIHSLPPSP